jgi:hypothetical protein
MSPNLGCREVNFLEPDFRTGILSGFPIIRPGSVAGTEITSHTPTSRYQSGQLARSPFRDNFRVANNTLRTLVFSLPQPRSCDLRSVSHIYDGCSTSGCTGCCVDSLTINLAHQWLPGVCKRCLSFRDATPMYNRIRLGITTEIRAAEDPRFRSKREDCPWSNRVGERPCPEPRQHF